MELHYNTYDAIRAMNYRSSHEVTLSGKRYKILTLHSRGPDGSTLEEYSTAATANKPINR